MAAVAAGDFCRGCFGCGFHRLFNGRHNAVRTIELKKRRLQILPLTPSVARDPLGQRQNCERHPTGCFATLSLTHIRGRDLRPINRLFRNTRESLGRKTTKAGVRRPSLLSRRRFLRRKRRARFGDSYLFLPWPLPLPCPLPRSSWLASDLASSESAFFRFSFSALTFSFFPPSALPSLIFT